jgi:hypothetical protein
VADESEVEQVQLICEPGSTSYERMTFAKTMPVLIDQRI